MITSLTDNILLLRNRINQIENEKLDLLKRNGEMVINIM